MNVLSFSFGTTLQLGGGNISDKNKPELVSIAKDYLRMQKEVPVQLVDRNPDPNGRLFAKINTSSTRPIGDILKDVRNSMITETGSTRDLIELAYELHRDGHFEDQYDNIARCAPELEENLIYQLFGHIGSSITEKNIGDALKRCWYDTGTSYHAMAFVPNTNKVIIMSKAHASMTKDQATRKNTPDGESPEKQEYLVIMEMIYEATNGTTGKHDLGIFVGMNNRTFFSYLPFHCHVLTSLLLVLLHDVHQLSLTEHR